MPSDEDTAEVAPDAPPIPLPIMDLQRERPTRRVRVRRFGQQGSSNTGRPTAALIPPNEIPWPVDGTLRR